MSIIDEYRFPISIDRNRQRKIVVTSINIDAFAVEIDDDFFIDCYRLLWIDILYRFLSINYVWPKDDSLLIA